MISVNYLEYLYGQQIARLSYAPINVNLVGGGGVGVRARGGDLMPESIPLSGF